MALVNHPHQKNRKEGGGFVPLVFTGGSWSSLVEGDEGCISPSGKLSGFMTSRKHLQHLHDIIPYMFHFWANPVVHLPILKSSMGGYIGSVGRRARPSSSIFFYMSMIG